MALYIRAVGTPKGKNELFKADLHPARFHRPFFQNQVFISVCRFFTFPQLKLMVEYTKKLIFILKYDQK